MHISKAFLVLSNPVPNMIESTLSLSVLYSLTNAIRLLCKFAVQQLPGAVPGFDSIGCCRYKHAVRWAIST